MSRCLTLPRLRQVSTTPADDEVDRIVLAWQRGSQGRKHHSGSALFTAGGALLARAEATWIAVDPTTIRPKDQP